MRSRICRELHRIAVKLCHRPKKGLPHCGPEVIMVRQAVRQMRARSASVSASIDDAGFLMQRKPGECDLPLKKQLPSRWRAVCRCCCRCCRFQNHHPVFETNVSVLFHAQSQGMMFVCFVARSVDVLSPPVLFGAGRGRAGQVCRAARASARTRPPSVGTDPPPAHARRSSRAGRGGR